MWCETINNFLANHGILMQMFLHDIVLSCALIAFCVGVFLGWVFTEVRDGVTWKENIIQPWPYKKDIPWPTT